MEEIDAKGVMITEDYSKGGVWGGLETLERMFQSSSLSQTVEDGIAKPPLDYLFDSLWMEDQLCVLFADNGVGKSILAVQIAESIASGVPIGDLRLTAKPQKVLYFDFEMTDRQLARRYSDEERKPHVFHPNLIRLAIDRTADITLADGSPGVSLADGLEGDLMLKAIEGKVREHGAKIVIIDNLTAICKQSADAEQAMPFLEAIGRIRQANGLSMLVLAHTPKIEYGMPITKNDLGGSKHISNFVDSVFAIGRCTGVPDHRYIKQLKSRDNSEEYGEGNVLVFELSKKEAFLGFTFVNTNTERNVLYGYKTYTKAETEEYRKQAISEIDDSRAYTRMELVAELMANENKKGTDAQKEARARKHLQRSPHKVIKGDKIYINPHKFFK